MVTRSKTFYQAKKRKTELVGVEKGEEEDRVGYNWPAHDPPKGTFCSKHHLLGKPRQPRKRRAHCEHPDRIEVTAAIVRKNHKKKE